MPGDARNYFGLTLEMVGNAVMEYLLDKKQVNPFFQDEAGMIGVWGFMRTWPKLTERKSQHLPAIMQCTTVTEGDINAWVSTVISDAGLDELTEGGCGIVMIQHLQLM